MDWTGNNKRLLGGEGFLKGSSFLGFTERETWRSNDDEVPQGVIRHLLVLAFERDST